MSSHERRQPPTVDTMTPPPGPVQGSVSGSTASFPQSRLARIAERAYAIYERRGGQDGSSVDDWLQAEREIDSET